MCRKAIHNQLGMLVLFFFLVLPTAQAMQDLLQQAHRHLANGENQQAYTLLEQRTEQHSGNTDFDYLLGVSALRSGHPGEAMFALERVIRTQPGHAAARMELVSAYLQLGMNHQAQTQLAILENQRPPESARAAMDRYQDILRPRLSGTPDPVRLLALSAGYDSNVGSYPEMDLLGFIPIKPVDSAYALVRGTLWQPVQLDENRRLDLTLHGQYRQHEDKDAEQFDLGLIHATALYNVTLNPHSSVGIGIQANKLWLDQDDFRDHIGLTSRWEQRLGADLRGDLGLEFLDYQFEQKNNDYQQINLHGRVHKTINPRLRLTGMLGYEQEDANKERLGGDANRWRLQGNVNWQMNPRNLAALSLNWSDTRYKNKYLANSMHNPSSSDKTRNDQVTELSARWRHLPARVWEINTEVSYRDQQSTVRFYELDRWTAQITLLRNF
jgi:hypothetical protein